MIRNYIHLKDKDSCYLQNKINGEGRSGLLMPFCLTDAADKLLSSVMT